MIYPLSITAPCRHDTTTINRIRFADGGTGATKTGRTSE